MTELELRGYIDSKDFLTKLAGLAEIYGPPKFKKRLTFSFADYKKLNVETKIRITNGGVEINQKVGDFNLINREEIIVFVALKADQVYELYLTYKNLHKDLHDPMITLMQHENYLFNVNDQFEIKLYRQFGRDEIYAFEVEATYPEMEKELRALAAKHELTIAERFNGFDEVKERNKKVNIDPTELSKQEITDLVSLYIGLDQRYVALNASEDGE